MHRLDLRHLELDGDILFWHLLDGLFGVSTFCSFSAGFEAGSSFVMGRPFSPTS